MVPWRSNNTPRGAGSGSWRMWLFSAISSNLLCWATWKTQKPSASSANATAIVPCSTPSLFPRWRPSSGIRLVDPLEPSSTEALAPHPPPLQQAGPRFDHLERDDPDRAVQRRLRDERHHLKP